MSAEACAENISYATSSSQSSPMNDAPTDAHAIYDEHNEGKEMNTATAAMEKGEAAADAAIAGNDFLEVQQYHNGSNDAAKVSMSGSKPKSKSAPSPEVIHRRKCGSHGSSPLVTKIKHSVSFESAAAAAANGAADEDQAEEEERKIRSTIQNTIESHEKRARPTSAEKKPKKSENVPQRKAAGKKTSALSVAEKATFSASAKAHSKATHQPEEREVLKTHTSPVVRSKFRTTNGTSKSPSPAGATSMTESPNSSRHMPRTLQRDDPVLKSIRHCSRRGTSPAAVASDVEPAVRLLAPDDAVPHLPPPVEVALVAYYKSGLLRQPVNQVERIVCTVCPISDRKAVMTHLKAEQQRFNASVAAAAYSNNTAPSGTSSDKKSSPPDWCKSPKVDRASPSNGHERHVNPAAALAARRRTDLTGVTQSPAVERFYAIFSNEVRAAFLEDCFSACQARRRRMYREQPRIARENGAAIPEQMLHPHYEKTVCKLLFRMFGWPEEEASGHAATTVSVFADCMPPVEGTAPAAATSEHPNEGAGDDDAPATVAEESFDEQEPGEDHHEQTGAEETHETATAAEEN